MITAIPPRLTLPEISSSRDTSKARASISSDNPSRVLECKISSWQSSPPPATSCGLGRPEAPLGITATPPRPTPLATSSSQVTFGVQVQTFSVKLSLVLEMLISSSQNSPRLEMSCGSKDDEVPQMITVIPPRLTLPEISSSQEFSMVRILISSVRISLAQEILISSSQNSPRLETSCGSKNDEVFYLITAIPPRLIPLAISWSRDTSLAPIPISSDNPSRVLEVLISSSQNSPRLETSCGSRNDEVPQMITVIPPRLTLPEISSLQVLSMVRIQISSVRISRVQV